MIGILHGFAVGIAFAFGVMSGAVIAAYAVRRANVAINQEIQAHYKKVEERLLASMHAHIRIAEALERDPKR